MRPPDTFYMNERDWKDVKRWSDDVTTPTPDRVWKELLRLAPKTVGRAKGFNEIRALVDYICEVYLSTQKANDLLAAGDRRYQELQRSYLEDKAIMVELARCFSRASPVSGEWVECTLPSDLLRKFLEKTRPLVVDQGTEELRRKDFDLNLVGVGPDPEKQEFITKLYQQSLIDSQQVMAMMGIPKTRKSNGDT